MPPRAAFSLVDPNCGLRVLPPRLIAIGRMELELPYKTGFICRDQFDHVAADGLCPSAFRPRFAPVRPARVDPSARSKRKSSGRMAQEIGEPLETATCRIA